MSVPATVRDFLRTAQHHAGLSGSPYHELAQSRLAVGAVEYGDSYRSRSLDALLGEITEEVLDVGTWSALAADVAIEAGEMELVADLLEITAQAVRLQARVAAARERVAR